jgi:hypothetical protein
MPQTVHISEGRSTQSNSLANFPAESTVSLERLLVHKFAFDWFEAVAILLRASENWNEEQRVLSFDPAHIIVRVDGIVATTAAAGRSSIIDPATAVQNLAAVFRDLLPELYPMPLRLAITQALSTPPFYPSISEFSEALQYFERPDRKSVVQAVFQRWKETRDQHTQNDTAPRVDPEHLDDRVQPPQRGNLLATKRPAILWGLAIAAVVCAPLTLLFWFAPAGMEQSVAAIEKAGGAVITRAASIASNLLTQVAPSPSLSDKQPIRAASATATEAPKPTTNGRIVPAAAMNGRPAPPALLRNPARAALSGALLNSFSGPTLLGIVPQLDTNVELDALSNLVASDSESAEVRVIVAPGGGSTIYSAQDADVVPATAVYPHLPASAFVAQDDALMFDVVVDHAGHVESVRALRPAPTMGSALRLTLSLSAAKSWRFQPAIKDGQGVRYRHTIWIPFP